MGQPLPIFFLQMVSKVLDVPNKAHNPKRLGFSKPTKKESRMKKLFRHIKRWNRWRKRSMNGKIHKALVLLGVTKSPTMPFILLPEEEAEFATGKKCNPKKVMDGQGREGASITYDYEEMKKASQRAAEIAAEAIKLECPAIRCPWHMGRPCCHDCQELPGCRDGCLSDPHRCEWRRRKMPIEGQ